MDNENKTKGIIPPLDEKVISGIKELQSFHRRYFAVYDVTVALIWMTEELGELARAARIHDTMTLKEKLGTLCMWCFSLANSLEIDLSKSIERTVDMYQWKHGSKV